MLGFTKKEHCLGEVGAQYVFAECLEEWYKGKSVGFSIMQTWIPVLPLSLTTYVIQSKLNNCSQTQFPHL